MEARNRQEALAWTLIAGWGWLAEGQGLRLN